MKLYKGYLHFYCATGEQAHFYVWTGDPNADQHDWNHHIMINETDIVEFTNEEERIKHIILHFPQDMATLKKMLKAEDYDRFLQAAVEHWPVEIVKFET